MGDGPKNCVSFSEDYEILQKGTHFAVLRIDSDYYLVSSEDYHKIGSSMKGLTIQIAGKEAAILDT